MPLMPASISPFISASFTLTCLEVRTMRRRFSSTMTRNSGMMIRITSASFHWMVNMMIMAPMIVTPAMNRSSGPWWENSVISNRSPVIRLSSCPVRFLSKNSKSRVCIFVNRSSRRSASTRTPNICPQYVTMYCMNERSTKAIATMTMTSKKILNSCPGSMVYMACRATSGKVRSMIDAIRAQLRSSMNSPMCGRK